ncbi:MAG: SDR family oxidoreductase [Proteobacteria bacterium]|nr:SDR family oxidoreductase [Pseudomonadota bacterium]HQR04801.1 SDR family oxidoreductase [Rhodocyclaceae bacterium]
MGDPSLSGKTIVISGPTAGIGRATALALGARGAHLLLLCRSAEKGDALAGEIRARGGSARTVVMDMGRLASVAHAAEEVMRQTPHIDVLINNAGTINTRRRETHDGFEEMFGVNTLAPILLTRRLLPVLRTTPGSRIVHVASAAHTFVGAFDFDDYNWQRRRFRTFAAYGQSKLGNLLFNHRLARELEGSGVTSNTLHPGAVSTSLGTNNGTMGRFMQRVLKPFFLTPEQGAATSIYLAASPEAARHHGEYLVACKVARPKGNALDTAAADRLWQLAGTLLATHGCPV